MCSGTQMGASAAPAAPLLLLRVLLLLAGAAAQTSYRCPGPEWSLPTNSSACYRPLNTSLTFAAADASCRALAPAASLATIRTAPEAAFVVTQRCGMGSVTRMSSSEMWMGLNDIAVEAGSSRSCCWAWMANTSTTEFMFSAAGQALWLGPEPNNAGGIEDCAEVSSVGFMNDVTCANLRWSCCEAPAASATASATASPTASPSASLSVGASPSGSLTATASSTASVTGSRTPTVTQTASSTSSVTPTPTRTATPTWSPASAACPGAGWYNPEGSASCYRPFPSTTLTFADAASFCTAQAGGTGSLASVRSDADAAFVIGARCGMPPTITTAIWTSLNDISSEAFSIRTCCWSWINGASNLYIRGTVGVTKWAAGEPNNFNAYVAEGEDCVEVGT